jgi:hypothetical protein
MSSVFFSSQTVALLTINTNEPYAHIGILDPELPELLLSASRSA